MTTPSMSATTGAHADRRDEPETPAGTGTRSAVRRVPTLKPGSQCWCVARTVAVLCDERGRAVTRPEVDAAIERITAGSAVGADKALAALVSRGVVHAVGRRDGYTTYAPAGTPLAASASARPLPDRQAEALACLREAYRAHGREVVVREIEAVHRTRLATGEASPLSPPVGTALFKALGDLSRPAGSRGLRRPALVERREHVLASTVTRAVVLWRPAGMPVSPSIPETVRLPGGGLRGGAPRPSGLAFASVVRRLVGFSVVMSGRPVSGSDVRLLVENVAAHALASASGDDGATSTLERLARTVPHSRVVSVLRMTASRDAKQLRHPRRLQTIESPLAGPGGTPPRYRLGEPTPLDLACCQVEDAAAYLHVATELDGIDALRRRAMRSASPALAHLAWLRAEVLHDWLWRALSGERADAVRHRLLRALEWRRALISERPAQPAATADERRRWRARWDGHVRAVADVLGTAPRAARLVAPFGTVGTGPLVTWDEITPLLQATIRQETPEVTDRALTAKLKYRMRDTRRVSNPAYRCSGKVGTVRRGTPVFLDRADAYYAVFRETQGSVTRMLLRNARALTGEVLRDPAIVTGWLGAEEHLDPASRRALVVYAGLLGELLPVTRAVPDPADGGDAAAWVLSCVLAGPAEAPDRLEASRGEFRGGAAEVVDMAQRRLDAGRLAAVVG